MNKKLNIKILVLFLIIANFTIAQTTLSVTNGGKMNISSGTSVQNQNLNIGSGSQLVNRGDLTVSGVLANDAGTPGLVLKADENGYGALMHNSTGVMAKVEQYLTSERWHLISSPVAWASVEAYWDIYLKDWTEPSSSWYYIVEPDLWPQLYPTEGYAVWADDNLTGTTTVSLEGELMTGQTAFNYLSYSPTASQYGWNLVGNPYPSSVEWNTDWYKWHVSGWALFYNNGVYDGWNPWLPVGEQSYNGRTDGWMAPNQGFWIRAVGSDPYISSPQSARALHPDPFLKESQDSGLQSLHLTATANSYIDETTILFLEDASVGFDGLYDLGKMYNVDEAPNIFSKVEGNEYSVNVLPLEFLDVSASPVIQINFKLGVEEECVISVSGIESFDLSIPIYLEDLHDDVMTNLRNQASYVFSATPLDDPNRFLLHFGEPLDIEKFNTNTIRIYSHQEAVYIKLAENEKGEAAIFDMMGRKVCSMKLNDQLTKKSLSQTGYFIVKVKTDTGVSIQKVYIKD